MFSSLYERYLKGRPKRWLLILIFIIFSFWLNSWYSSHKQKEAWKEEKDRSPKVTDNGQHIEFPSDSPALAKFETVKVGIGNASFSVLAPARVIASINTSVNSGEKIILFDSGETTQIYAEYKRGRAVTSKSLKDLNRVRDMYANQAATGREVAEAESNFAIAKSESAEAESKLRTIGFNPKELDSVTGSSLWLICDVPESQLSEVQKGEEVRIQFSSFPGKIFLGEAEAVGEVVDPILRTVKVRVTIKNPKDKILPGMYARVDFGDPRTSVIVLPNNSIVTVDEKSYVFIQEEPGIFIRRQVILGTSGEDRTIINGGLQTGDNVIINGAFLLKGLSFGF
ncbi:HlyD family efflux transporter periplasmic adaptor subunit [Leptospira selangorensis]|uniref:HlyD family efflux transporter periplasmic adaptor subunit n=1 Tax=Leptospira selangorensis TaxID=2484982 RepID=A0ABY2N253_9LEPT|nr:efflux RND transporter periplasmic adaptor subunit [Leptospira selangorensis]TGM14534.1 HlyD family efflux transporter periplasmic adaptor subunit [Leptospira selangorensis]